jgi:hypothetical protein
MLDFHQLFLPKVPLSQWHSLLTPFLRGLRGEMEGRVIRQSEINNFFTEGLALYIFLTSKP